MCEKYDEGFSILSPKVSILRAYAVIPRYPNELAIASEDMQTALQYARDVKEFVLEAIESWQE